jgi:hypothetical protein
MATLQCHHRSIIGLIVKDDRYAIRAMPRREFHTFSQHSK